MKKLITTLLFFFSSLCASQREFFEDENPLFFHHVNVISGQLVLSFHDGELVGPTPFPITRLYTSSGALERNPSGNDLRLKKLRESPWMFQGGWSFLPHANLLLQNDTYCPRIEGPGTFATDMPYDGCCYQALLPDETGQMVCYKCFEHQPGIQLLRPEKKHGRLSTRLSARDDPKHNILRVEDGKLTLFLPDGTQRHYSGDTSHRSCPNYFHLTLEVLPNKHRVVYHYKGKHLNRIELQNPSGSTTFASMSFDESLYEGRKSLSATTSTGEALSYSMMEFKERTYLEKVKSKYRKEEKHYYQPARKGIGARVGSACFEGREKLHVDYYEPGPGKEKKWARHSYDIPLEGDKVKSLSFPDPETGEMVEFAHFHYHREYTKVVDYEGVVTKYYHNKENLKKIEYSDHEGLYCTVHFDWRDGHLASKSMSTKNGRTLFAKSFLYDGMGNVTKEQFQDSSLSRDPVHRSYTYYPHTNLPKTEEEEGGLKYVYEYLDGTDLITKKLTQDKDQILVREFFFYNQDNLLACQVTDDGSSSNPSDYQGMTQRTIKYFEFDPCRGLCIARTDRYLDIETRQEKQICRQTYSYSRRGHIITETFYDENDQERYTIYTDYDDAGHVIGKTTPMGRMATYEYDEQGNLIESKEVGKPKLQFAYNHANLMTSYTEGERYSENTYDRKGRLTRQKDKNGNILRQKFDCFGRCQETSYPKVLDENGHPHTPRTEFSHDWQGNIATCTSPQGYITRKTYNALRTPTKIEHPNGEVVENQYSNDGMLLKTLSGDGTAVHYTYDLFKRMTSKTILSKKQEVFLQEFWEYNAFHLLSYTDPLGLITYYEYDGRGRKIAETSEGRSITYSYDELGFLEKTTSEGSSQVTIHNEEGEVIEQWEEDSDGSRVNYTKYFYNEEGQRVKAHRLTFEGIAEDLFFHDEEGRLVKHIDPEGNATEILYTQVINALDQTVEQKTTIDPKGNTQIVTYDAAGRVVLLEKTDPHGQTVSSEATFYDKAGNKAQRISTIYDHNTLIRTHTTKWEYNSRGWPIKEVEQDLKETTYTYDITGRMIQKKLPSGVTLSYKYDPLGRILELKSSDKTIHYTFVYDRSSDPIEATDQILRLTWNRSYNLFGERTKEILPNGATLQWEYDSRGRCTHFTLPDNSSIRYSYTGLHLTSVSRYTSSNECQYTHTYTQFDPNGHVQEEELIYGLGSIITKHDLLERPHTQTTPWNTHSVEYGPSGLIKKIENSFFKTKEIRYDALDQLTQEGRETHSFDSLGNPLKSEVNALNQITATSNSSLSYDSQGNPLSEGTITYTYDALNRLTSIHHPDRKHTQYIYDPFSRLYCKAFHESQDGWFYSADHWSRDITFYLYDQDKEIGTLDSNNAISQLKVLGLGLRGDIGGAIALELDATYIPLHDFQGNIIALVSSSGKLKEKHDIDAFGKKIPTTTSKSPWRFSSKRTEGHLIFFGARFYHPTLGRWLTPDPAGSIDSPNLYLYTRNSPLNRLDLFGFYSEDFRTEIPIHARMDNSPYLTGTCFLGNATCDWVLYCNNFHQLSFTPEELQAGSFDIFNHFEDLLPKEGSAIGVTLFQNGINNNYDEFRSSFESIVSKVPGDNLLIGMYNPGNGVLGGFCRSIGGMAGYETKMSSISGQTMLAISETTAEVNSGLLWLSIPHSEAGIIMNDGLDRLTKKEQDLISEKMIWLGIAPGRPLEKGKGVDVVDIYSSKDNLTQLLGTLVKYPELALFETCPDLWTGEAQKYNVETVPCISKWSERNAFLFDHGIMSPTYQQGLVNKIGILDRDRGFYKSNR